MKNGRTDRDAVWGSRSSHMKGTFEANRCRPIATQWRTLANVSTRRTRRMNAFALHRKGWQDGDAAFCQITLDTCLLLAAASSIVVLCMVHPPVGLEQSPLIPSLPHLLLYLLLSFTFPFFSLLLVSSIFLLFHPFPFYQNSPTLFLDRMS